jgi:hypothetical protein
MSKKVIEKNSTSNNYKGLVEFNPRPKDFTSVSRLQKYAVNLQDNKSNSRALK